MSDRGILQRYAGRDVAELESRLDGAIDDLGCFGWLRGMRESARMLELRKKDGSIRAVGYAWLERAEFDPTDGITLHVGGEQIRIVGRNLNSEVRPSMRLFEGITRHRVSYIREADRAERLEGADETTIVEGIGW